MFLGRWIKNIVKETSLRVFDSWLGVGLWPRWYPPLSRSWNVSQSQNFWFLWSLYKSVSHLSSFFLHHSVLKQKWGWLPAWDIYSDGMHEAREPESYFWIFNITQPCVISMNFKLSALKLNNFFGDNFFRHQILTYCVTCHQFDLRQNLAFVSSMKRDDTLWPSRSSIEWARLQKQGRQCRERLQNVW